MDLLSTVMVLPFAFGAAATVRTEYERLVERSLRTTTPAVSTVISLPATQEITTLIRMMELPATDDWLSSLLKNVRHLASFQDGWDGDGSRAPTYKAKEAALDFLKNYPAGATLPKPMLTCRGELEFYWDADSGYADLSFDEDGMGSFFARRRDDGKEIFIDGLSGNWHHHSDANQIFEMIAPHMLLKAAA